VIVDPPKTVEECLLSGWLFGCATTTMPCVAFEQTLVASLQALEEELLLTDLDAEETLAAFDHAAWTGWEAGQALWKNQAGSLPFDDEGAAGS
jgi:hypothetical protein